MKLLKLSSFDKHCPAGVFALGADDFSEVLVMDIRSLLPHVPQSKTQRNDFLEFISIAGGKLRLPLFKKVKIVDAHTIVSQRNFLAKTNKIHVVSAAPPANWKEMFPSGAQRIFPRLKKGADAQSVQLFNPPLKTSRWRTGIDFLDNMMAEARWGWAGPFLVQVLEQGLSPAVVLVSQLEGPDTPEETRLLVVRKDMADDLGIPLAEIPFEGGWRMRHLQKGGRMLVAN